MQLLPPTPTSKAPTDRFTGDVWVDLLPVADPPSPVRGGIVRFAPGAHTAWHRHRHGQTLYILDGHALVQARGGQVLRVGPGDTVDTPPGEWHWHGADPDHFMTHLALSYDPGDNQVHATEWGDHPAAEECPGDRPAPTPTLEWPAQQGEPHD